MVFLEIYDPIWTFLEKEEILDEIKSEVESIFGKKFLSKHENTSLFPDIILEYALFNCVHKDMLLIDYLSKEFSNTLEEADKKQFSSLMDSQRRDFILLKKISRTEIDAEGRKTYDFYYRDIHSGDTKIIFTSSELDLNEGQLNMRLVKYCPYDEERYSIIGLIRTPEQVELLHEMNLMRQIEKNRVISENKIALLFEQSRKLNFDEIKAFKDEKSNFITGDRKIMKLNKSFYEFSGMNLDEFLNNAYELSNDTEKFREVCEYYLSISKEFEKAVYSTNYIFKTEFFSYDPLLKAFLGFILNDFKLLEKGIAEFQKEAKEDFRKTKHNILNKTREKITENEKKSISEMIDGMKKSKNKEIVKKAEEYSDFLRDIDKVTMDELSLFLTKLIEFLSKEKKELKGFSNKDTDMFFEIKIAYLKDLKEDAHTIPYLKDIKEEYKNFKFNPEYFYDYFQEISEEMYNLTRVMYSAHFFSFKKYQKAYDLINELNIEKNDCFCQMFYIGSVFSLFENRHYKKYFNTAKKIDRFRYKEKLESFLALKNSESIEI